MNPSLAAHYEGKYAGEASPEAATRIVRPGRAPTDRFEACLRSFSRVFAGGDVLELGAGNGLVARSLLAAGLDCHSYTLSETSEARLEGLRAGLDDPRLRTARIDAERVPEELFGRFDAIVMVALIEHLVDPLAAMQRIRRLLRPGGFVYVDTPNVAKWTRRLKLLAGRFPSTASQQEGLVTYDGAPVDLHDEGHLHYFTYRSLERMLVERCGFSSVERHPYTVGGRLGAPLRHALARLAPGLCAELAVVARR